MNIRRILLYVVAIVALSFHISSEAQSPSHPSMDCCSITSKALEAVEKIHKGETRADVERQFVRDGGIFTREETRYSFLLCPAIKVDISFVDDKKSGDFVSGSPDDMVTSVSKPYLQYPMKD